MLLREVAVLGYSGMTHARFTTSTRLLALLDPVLEQGQKNEEPAVGILDELLGIELAQRFERRVETNLKLSDLPRPKTHKEFDFEAQPPV